MIHFDSINIDTPEFINEQTVDWISRVIHLYGRRVGELKYIFVTDEFLYEMNVNYLNHNTYTDIITFNTSENDDFVSGELYISLERVSENAEYFIESFDNEMFRVLIHGVLHLLGFNDKLKAEEAEMRKQEEICLSLLT